jgi:hypothetical protein
VIDESASGFLIEADRIVPAQRGDVLRLHRQGGWLEVEITRIARQAGKTWIGVRRLRDLFEAEESVEKYPVAGPAGRSDGAPPQPPTGTVWALVLGLCGVIGLAMVVGQTVLVNRPRDSTPIESEQLPGEARQDLTTEASVAWSRVRGRPVIRNVQTL